MHILQSLQGQFSGFHFLILFLKTLKIRLGFVTIRNNAAGNRTKIVYAFGPVKYRPNKRSGKLRIKSQILRVTNFLSKNIAD